MICLRSQLYLNENTSASEVWNAISQWRINSRNTANDVKTWFSNNPYERLQKKPIDLQFGQTSISYYAVSNTNFAFKLSEESGNYITTICFNSKIKTSNFSLEMEISNPAKNKFSRPKIFDYLTQFLPNDIYSITAMKDGDYNKISKIFLNNKYDLPVIYISSTQNDKYSINPDELSKSLYGIAHVFKEPNNSFSKQLKKISNGKNPYNGTIGIFYKNNRIYISPEKIEKFDFFHRISQLSLLIQFDEKLTWYGIIRPYLQKATENIQTQVTDISKQIQAITAATILNDLKKQIELAKTKEHQKKIEQELAKLKESLEKKESFISQLQEQLEAEKEEKEAIEKELENTRKEYSEYISTFDVELEEKQLEIERLLEENEKLKAYEAVFAEKDNNGITISINCSEKPLYPNEFEDFIKGLIYQVASKYNNFNGGTEKDPKGFIRIHHVLKSIFENNKNFDFQNSNTYNIIQKIEKASPDTDKEASKILEDIGFVKDESTKGHPKFFFHNDKRYSITIPSTWGDKRSSRNYLSQATHCVLNPKEIK